MIRKLLSLATVSAVVLSSEVRAYSVGQKATASKPVTTSKNQNGNMGGTSTAASAAVATAAATAALSLMLTTSEPAFASSTAAQINLNSIPPTSIDINIKDLPVVGDLLSGTYTKVTDPKSITGAASLSISSPKDKLGAIKSAATGGHLEFDVNGLVATHLDVDLATDDGVATVRVASPLIPKLPIKNKVLSPSGKKSDWYTVTNMGSGEVYYYNDKTDESTLVKPSNI